MECTGKKSLLVVVSLVGMFFLVGQAWAVDIDGDGVDDANDLCIDADANYPVDGNGCIDTDDDGITDSNDLCEGTPAGHSADVNGCADDDGDGVYDYLDLCLGTPPGDVVDGDGCSDDDGDGVYGFEDNCPDACNVSQDDGDGDGIGDTCDNCPSMNSLDQGDDDGDGMGNPCDQCDGTPAGHAIDASGCSDDDGDGVHGEIDNCPDNANAGQEDVDADEVGDECDICSRTDPKWAVTAEGCADRDEDGVPDYEDLCPVTDNRIVALGVDGNGCRVKRWFEVHMNQRAGVFRYAAPWEWSTYPLGHLDDDLRVNYPVGYGGRSAVLEWGHSDPNYRTYVWFRAHEDGHVELWDACDVAMYDPYVDGRFYDANALNPTDPCRIVAWSNNPLLEDRNLIVTVFEVYDSDNDGVPDGSDLCPDTLPDPGYRELLYPVMVYPVWTSTPPSIDVDPCGCPPADADGDWVPDSIDLCPGTGENDPVDQDGCLDTDRDGVAGVANADDDCPSSPLGATVDQKGCTDADGDGVYVPYDQCETQGSPVNSEGCTDSDGDGVADTEDLCDDPCTWVAENGCPDTDRDGVADIDDLCPDPCTWVDGYGCPDTDGDGVGDGTDSCPGTPGEDTVDETGCTTADADGDGIPDPNDDCDDTPAGREINEFGCHWKRIKITTDGPLWQLSVWYAEGGGGAPSHNDAEWPYGSFIFDLRLHNYGVVPPSNIMGNTLRFGPGDGTSPLEQYFRVYEDGKCQLWDPCDVPYWQKQHNRPGGCPISGSRSHIEERFFDYTTSEYPHPAYNTITIRCPHPTTGTWLTSEQGAPPGHPDPINTKCVENIDSDGDGIEDPIDECPTLPVDPNLSLVDRVGCPIWPACDDPWRPSPAGDIDVDCYVTETDVLAMGSQWLQCTHPLDGSCTQLQPSPEELYPNMMYMPYGVVSVDGIIDEAIWADPCWVDLDLFYYGDPCDIVSAKYAVCWGDVTGDPCSMIYALVIVEDTDHVLGIPLNWNDTDRIEVYVQGDPNGGDEWGSNTAGQFFDKAQQYAVGKLGFGVMDWFRWADGTTVAGGSVPDSARFQAEARRSGSVFTYEIGATAWQWYGGRSGATSTVRELKPGGQVGFDVIVDSRYGSLGSSDPGYADDFGMLSANLETQKFVFAERFQRWELLDYDGMKVPPECGDWGYLVSDIYRDADCLVGLPDFAVISNEWMDCTDPCAPCGYDPF